MSVAHGCNMVKDAAISVRVDEALKEHLENQARDEGRSLAAYVERVLQVHTTLPRWRLDEPQALNSKKRGAQVALPIAEGWPLATLSAEHAERLGKQLISLAQAARKLPVT